MLETRTQPNLNRTRRLDAVPRPGIRPDRPARSTARPGAVGNTALETVPGLPQPRPAVKPQMSRLGRSEMRLMGLATTCTAIVCGLLLLYLAAYAHVSQLGYDQAEARVQLRHIQLQNESLRAERDRLQSRRHIIQEALALGMMPRGSTPISYITARAARRAEDNLKPDGLKADGLKTARESAAVAPDGEQGINGDTTAGGDKQPSFGH